MTDEPKTNQHEITSLLQQLDKGNKQVQDRLLNALYSELHRLAELRLWGEQKANSLRPTEMVNEVYLRLLANSDRNFQDRGHFFATAARAMRNILVDYIRNKGTDKRGGGLTRVEFDDGIVLTAERFDEVLAVQEALDRLEKVDPDQARIVEMRYFGGFQMQEISELLGVPLRTIEREWEYARNWLYSEFTKSGVHGSRTLAAD